MGWGLRIKKFNIMGFHWKIQFLGEVHEKTIYKRDCLKRAGGGGAVTVFKFKRGLGKKEGGVFDGGWYPNVIHSLTQDRYQAFLFQNFQIPRLIFQYSQINTE